MFHTHGLGSQVARPTRWEERRREEWGWSEQEFWACSGQTLHLMHYPLSQCSGSVRRGILFSNPVLQSAPHKLWISGPSKALRAAKRLWETWRGCRLQAPRYFNHSSYIDEYFLGHRHFNHVNVCGIGNRPY